MKLNNGDGTFSQITLSDLIGKVFPSSDDSKRSFYKSSKRVIVNKVTGVYHVVDPEYSRYVRMCKRVFAWAGLLSIHNDVIDRYMITLTYAPDKMWEAKHISKFIYAMKKRLRKNNIIGYSWVAELQRRGVIHYHIIVAMHKGSEFYSAVSINTRSNGSSYKSVSDGFGFPDALGDWSYGMSRVDVARSMFYIVSYTNKKYQKFGQFPTGARMFGSYLNRKFFSTEEIGRLRISTHPDWVKSVIEENNLSGIVSKRVKGGYEISGEFIQSPFIVFA